MLTNCYNCNGSGKIKYSGKYIKCNVCNGTKMLEVIPIDVTRSIINSSVPSYYAYPSRSIKTTY